MRILFDSQEIAYKKPFGTLVPGQECRLRMRIPLSVGAYRVVCLVQQENGLAEMEVPLEAEGEEGAYGLFAGRFSLARTGLYFYYFRISGHTGTFRLFKQGHDTNMEAGDLWQVSCVPKDFTVPHWAMGATIYQVFPDRFCKSGACDLTGKLTPFTIHGDWNEEVDWRPDEQGRVLNNDFYGGNFRGITEKLPYIASLGATILYLNPISKSFSNHRYDTGDYKTPDPMLGTEAEFAALCDAAHQLGVRVVLDGVYSHTGSNSLYFDREGTFGGKGAYCDPHSPYLSWFTFRNYPNDYRCWWDFDTLPTVNKLDPAFVDYIITGEDSVVAHWLRLGADGFRLDVADELPDGFILLLKQRIRQLKPDALLIGEVWEDASNKISYDIRRRYFVDGMLDSVMNYPFRTAILEFIRGRDDGHGFREQVMTLAENYPPQVLHCNMNLLGTHDTPRILTALWEETVGSREEQARRRLSPEERALAMERLKMASFLQYMLPGAPSLYYGDEAGMEGGKDPFNRRTYPWGREDAGLLGHFRRLGQLRRMLPALQRGEIRFFRAENGQIGFSRTWEGQEVRCYVNQSQGNWQLPQGRLLLGHGMDTVAEDALVLGAGGFCLLEVANG